MCKLQESSTSLNQKAVGAKKLADQEAALTQRQAALTRVTVSAVTVSSVPSTPLKGSADALKMKLSHQSPDLAAKLAARRQWENVDDAGDVGKSGGDGARAGVDARAGDGSSGNKLMPNKSEAPPTSNPAQKTKSANVLQADDLTARLAARRQWETISEGSASV
jgi:hypothetical protein